MQLDDLERLSLPEAEAVLSRTKTFVSQWEKDQTKGECEARLIDFCPVCVYLCDIDVELRERAAKH